MRRSMLVATVGAVAGVTVLTGCGAGQEALTADNLPSVPGVNASEGDISVRNARIPFDAEGHAVGGDAPVRVTFANQLGGPPVELASAETPFGREVAVVAAEQLAGPPATAPGDAAADPAPGEDGAAVVLPSETLVDATLEIRGLTREVTSITTVPLELTFDNDVVIPITVTMAPPESPVPREEQLDVGYH